MLDKLSAINDRYDEVEKLISSPDAMNDMKLYVQLSKEYKDFKSFLKHVNASASKTTYFTFLSISFVISFIFLFFPEPGPISMEVIFSFFKNSFN